MSNALNVSITICMKLKVDFNQMNCVGAPSCIWCNWWWTKKIVWAYGYKDIGCTSPFSIIFRSFYNCKCSQHVGPNLGPKVQRVETCHWFSWPPQGQTIDLTKYDKAILILLLVKCSHFLNFHVVIIGPSLVECPSNYLFDT